MVQAKKPNLCPFLSVDTAGLPTSPFTPYVFFFNVGGDNDVGPLGAGPLSSTCLGRLSGQQPEQHRDLLGYTPFLRRVAFMHRRLTRVRRPKLCQPGWLPATSRILLLQYLPPAPDPIPPSTPLTKQTDTPVNIIPIAFLISIKTPTLVNFANAGDNCTVFPGT